LIATKNVCEGQIEIADGASDSHSPRKIARP
jgi:hypothetical protein